MNTYPSPNFLHSNANHLLVFGEIKNKYISGREKWIRRQGISVVLVKCSSVETLF